MADIWKLTNRKHRGVYFVTDAGRDDIAKAGNLKKYIVEKATGGKDDVLPDYKPNPKAY
jgi:hypothetical protein